MAENNVAVLDRRTLIGIAAAGLAASLASCAARMHARAKAVKIATAAMIDILVFMDSL